MIRFFIAIAAFAALSLNVVRADDESSIPDESPSTLATQIQSVHDSAVRDAGIDQADQLRQIPAQLRERNIPVTAEQEAKFNLAADRLAANANDAGFKDRVVNALKKAEHGLKRAGIESLKGIGYAGSAVFAASLTPFVFGTDLASSLILGHGVIIVGANNNIEGLIGYSGGITAFYYVYVGLQALGYTMDATVIASAAGVYLVNEVVCLRKAQESGSSELDHYCDENAKIMRSILRGSAGVADKIGGTASKPFRHPAKPAELAPVPAPAATAPNNAVLN